MTDNTSATGKPSVWPTMAYHDAGAAISFLTTAFGFTEVCRYGEGDVIHHAELAWPEGAGGVMLGGVRPDHEFSQAARTNSIYVVTADPDTVYKRATAAGAQVVRELRDEDYGSRGFSVRDPEGNLWSFGTYPGE